MRKIIALSLSVLMILLTVIPVGVFAQEAESKRELEELIKAVKRKFDIPEELKFTDYYASTNEKGVKTWSLSWNDKEKDISLSIRITDKGVITRYRYYEPYKDMGKKFPKVSEEEALRIAESFIDEIAPAGTLENIRRQDETDGQILFLKDNYYFNYYRVVNGIPYYSNSLSISVNSETGKIISYNYNIDEDLVFPSLDNIISLEDAEKAYENNLGLKLIYRYYHDYKNEKIDIYPAYVPKYDNGTYAVDAVTGGKIRTGAYYYDEIIGMDAAMNGLAQAEGSAEPVLTPEELEAARKQAQLLTEKEAESIVRETPETGIDDGYVLWTINLSSGWPEKDKFIYTMTFRKDMEDENNENKEGYIYLYATASVDAKTGEILRFYTDNLYLEGEPGFDKDAARAKVEKFLQGFKPEKFAETLLEEEDDDEFVMYRDNEEKPQRYYYFKYVRQVNGIPFPDNGLYVTFDGVQGKVTNFNMSWFDVDFPGLENAISSEDAHAALYKNIGLELQYKQVGGPGGVIPLPEILPLPEDLTGGDTDSSTDNVTDSVTDSATDSITDSDTDEKPDGAVQEGDDAEAVLDGEDNDQPVSDSTGAAWDATDAAGRNGEAADDAIDKEGSIKAAIGESLKTIASLPASVTVAIDSAVRIKIPEIKAVYVLKSGKPLVLDAYTGDILDYNGKPYKDSKVPEYNDISGHFAEEQIKTLAKYGIISFSGPEYKPNEDIKQKDYLMLLSNILDNYYGPVIKEDSEQDDIDEMYKKLIREGIVEEEEKSPESLINRENAVKFLVRALKYREVAEIEGIFILPFDDEEDVAPGLKGYVAIASGLKIVQGSGGKFYPKNNLTRGEAAVMVYNYLDKK